MGTVSLPDYQQSHCRLLNFVQILSQISRLTCEESCHRASKQARTDADLSLLGARHKGSDSYRVEVTVIPSPHARQAEAAEATVAAVIGAAAQAYHKPHNSQELSLIITHHRAITTAWSCKQGNNVGSGNVKGALADASMVYLPPEDGRKQHAQFDRDLVNPADD